MNDTVFVRLLGLYRLLLMSTINKCGLCALDREIAKDIGCIRTIHQATYCSAQCSVAIELKMF